MKKGFVSPISIITIKNDKQFLVIKITCAEADIPYYI